MVPTEKLHISLMALSLASPEHVQAARMVLLDLPEHVCAFNAVGVQGTGHVQVRPSDHVVPD